jgi:hypothetical protein
MSLPTQWRNKMDAGASWFIIFTVLGLAIYFLPTIIAMARGHKNTAAILVVNMFLGWTFLGWVGALAWSCTNNVTAVNVNLGVTPEPPRHETFYPKTKRYTLKNS